LNDVPQHNPACAVDDVKASKLRNGVFGSGWLG